MKMCVLASDARFEYMKKRFAEQGNTLLSVEQIGECSVVILPLPLTRDGKTLNCREGYNLVDIISQIDKNALVLCGGVPNSISLMFHLRGIKPIDYSSVEEFAVRNAHATAEGGVELAMRNIDTTLSSQKILIIGYGRIGKFLAKMLGPKVTVTARKEKDLAWIECMGYNAKNTDRLEEYIGDYTLVFNTVPQKIIPVCCLGEDATLIELASISPSYYEKSSAKIIDGRALPPKYAPKTSKVILYNTINKIITEEIV